MKKNLYFLFAFTTQLKYLNILLHVFYVLQELTQIFPLAVYPNAPFQVWQDCTDTEMTLRWNYENTEVELFCQTEVVQPDGKVELV